MKKDELVQLLLNHKMIGELTKEDLDKMNVKALENLKKEMDKELAEAGESANVEPVQSQEPSKENETVPMEPFVSMCGLAFDPSKNGTCSTQCQKEFAEAYKACSENFAAQPLKVVKSKSSAAKGLGMNKWYHRPGSQGGELDRFFEEGNIGTVEEIAKFAECNTRRVMIHIKHLVADFDVSILQTTRKNDDGSVSTVYFWSEKDKRRKGEPVKGKTAFPNGFPKDHPCYKKAAA